MKYHLNSPWFVIFGGLLAPMHVLAAGLSISDAPMFVTETIAPNVIISPVYNFDYNEVSLIDKPYAELIACSTLEPYDGVTCSSADPEASGNTVILGAWSSAVVDSIDGWRVTPWPGACKTNNNADCKIGSIGKLYSNTTIYPLDRVYSSYGSYYYEQIHPLSYVSINNPGFSLEQNTDVLEELYPEAEVDGHVSIVTKGKQRYVRSDKNFLYFNKHIADQYGYQPWPTLGDYPAVAFPAYSTDTTHAYYNPLKKQQDGVDILADLSVPHNYWGYFTSSSLGDSTLQVNSLIGQFWVYTGGDVWRSTSYAAKKWNGTGSEAMSSADKQNFANWFTYWRSAYLANRGLVASLLHELGPDGADLLGRFRIGLYSRGVPVRVESGDSATVINSLAARLYYFATDFTGWNHAATTDYFKTEAPYRDNPADVNSPVRSCRRNYELILTPDYTGLNHYTGTGLDSHQIEDGDGDADLPVPYQDNISNQWGDVGAYGWKTDLINLTNNLLPGKRDPATWQHLVRYVVGPRARGHIFPDNVADYDAADLILNAQTPETWELSSSLITGGMIRYTVDDLWHMVLNSRGFFYTSDNVRDMVQKLLDSFNDILVRSVSGSAVATNTTSLQQGGLVYQATVESDWKGHLRAYNITPVTTTVDGVSTTRLTLDYSVPVWDLAATLSSQAYGDGWSTARKIITFNGTQGIPFDWTNIGSNTTVRNTIEPAASRPLGVTNPDIYAQRLIEYLRGSGECEDKAVISANCTAAGEFTLRRRNLQQNNYAAYSADNPNGRNVLGDIANSNPWLTTAPVAGLSDVDFPGYNQHRVAMASRSNVLYVGANDGMLHAVDAGTNANKGKELFAYVPSFVHSNLHHLAASNYAHKFFVDGAPFTAEASFDVVADGVTTTTWKTVLAGGVNKGGKGYYLLDVTNPTSVNEGTAVDLVLWEFTHPNDLHYTYNLPVADAYGQARQIARMNDGKWALIVGNGYSESAGKKACLFILPLSGPGSVSGDVTAGASYSNSTGYKKICVGNTDYSTDTAVGLDTNGLSTPTPVDTNGDGKVDVIYAGDLNGNMWRFDVSSTTPADWILSTKTSLLFTATNPAGTLRQPIISPPEVMAYQSGAIAGYLVLFGTGKFLESSDGHNTDIQSFYAVWDRGLTGVTRAKLLEQVLATESNGVTTRTQTSKPIPSYCTQGELTACGTDAEDPAPVSHLGWYWDMRKRVDGDPGVVDQGERMTGRVNLINGTVLFNTFIPSSDPCEYGGDGWLMGFNAVTGTMEANAIFDVNSDGKIDANDAASAGRRVGAALGGTTFAQGLSGSKIGILSPTNLGTSATEGSKMTAVVNPSSSTTGRVSWYELMD